MVKFIKELGIESKSLLDIRKSPFVRNVTTVASGTAIAQGITVAFSPLITRIYGAEAFGLLGTFTALVAVISPVAALTYPIAIVLPKNDSDARNIGRLCIYIGLCIAATVTLIILIAKDWIVNVLQIQEISAFIILIPLVIIFSAWLQVNQQWTIRKQLFKIKAKAEAFKAIIVNIAKTLIGLFYPLGAILIIISTLGHIIHAILIKVGLRNKSAIEEDPNEKNPNTQLNLKEIAKKHYDFPLYRAPQVFINAVSQNLPVLMLATFFGPAPAGFFTLGKRVLAMPSKLISQSVGDVFYPKITKAAHNKENLTKHILKATLGLAAVGFFPYAIIVVFGPWIFGFIFGSEWVAAGEYARWMALWLFFMYLNNPSIRIAPVISAQGFLLSYSIFTTALRFIVLAIGYYIYNSDLIAIALFGISGAISNVILISIILLKTKKYDVNNK